MQKLHRNIKVSAKLLTEFPVRHRIHIKNISMKDLEVLNDYYIIHLHRKNISQQLMISLYIDKEIIMKMENTKHGVCQYSCRIS